MKGVAAKFDAAPVVGIDVGGTFTDFAVAFPDGGLVFHKVPSEPHDPSLAVQRGLQALMTQYPALARSPIRIVHGTTLGVNALLQGKGANIALIVSTGMRDVLEIGRMRLPSAFDFRMAKQRVLVSRDKVFEINCRISGRGKTVNNATDEEISQLCSSIETSGVKAVAVALLNSYIDTTLEQTLAERIQARLPQLLITQSARIWPEIREFERCVAACVNAQIHPLFDAYLQTLEQRIRGLGADALLQLSGSSGGTLSVRSARERPLETLLSGPASGTTAAAKLAKACGLRSVLTFDMGGTSADIAVMIDGDVELTTSAYIGDVPIMMPVVEVSSIGAGGGSIISVDSEGIIKVGPESAGAHPGPACYGLGGMKPTITDCYVVLGFINPNGFLGGRMKLDKSAAFAALTEIASLLKLESPAHAAWAAIRVTTARMASELFTRMAMKGHQPSQQMLMPFGGAGPTHSVMLAQEAGLRGVAVPPAAATFCALGAAMADVRRDFVRSLGKARISQIAPILWKNWTALEEEASQWIEREGLPIRKQGFTYAADMRYSGQSHNLVIAVSEKIRRDESLSGLAEAFHRAHEAIYSFRESDDVVEIVTQRLSILGETPEISFPKIPRSAGAVTPIGRRTIFLEDKYVGADIFSRRSLGAGSSISGCAIVEENDLTLLVPSGWNVSADEHGILMIEREARNAA